MMRNNREVEFKEDVSEFQEHLNIVVYGNPIRGVTDY
jgi:hypothetical protein